MQIRMRGLGFAKMLLKKQQTNLKRLIIYLLLMLHFVLFNVKAQNIPRVKKQRDTLNQAPPTSHERVIRVYLIEDRNPIKQVLNFDFNTINKEKDSTHLVNCTTNVNDTSSHLNIEHLQEVFQMVFSSGSEFTIKIDSSILSKQTKILINDAIKNPLRWKNLEKSAIGGGIFIKKQPE